MQIESNTNRYLKITIVSGILLFIIFCFVYFIQLFNKKLTYTAPKPEKITTTFPLITSAEAEYVYDLPCQITNLNNEDTKYTFGVGNFDYIRLKLTANCVYLDADNQNQEVTVPLGAVIENEEGYFFSYLDRSFYTSPISMPDLLTGSMLKERIEKYIDDYAGFEQPAQIEPSDILILQLAVGNNEAAQVNTNQPNGTSDFIYYGSGFTKSWNINDFELFIKTGDNNYLPSLDDGRKLIPILRVRYGSEN